MMQYLAQGAGMAIENAVCLADKAVAMRGDFAAAVRDLRTGRVPLLARVYGEVYPAADVVRELRNPWPGTRTQAASLEGMGWLYGGPDFA